MKTLLLSYLEGPLSAPVSGFPGEANTASGARVLLVGAATLPLRPCLHHCCWNITLWQDVSAAREFRNGQELEAFSGPLLFLFISHLPLA